MRLSKLSFGQRLGWYFASFVYGVCVIAVGFTHRVFEGPTPGFAIGIFIISWLVGVLCLRIYLQDKDPTSFTSILGVDKFFKDHNRKRKREH
jgi:hypothetical protein